MDNSRCSNSTLHTTSSLTTCSGSSNKAVVRITSRSTMVRNKGIKASRNTKHRAKGVGSSRWRAAVRRDSSLTTLQMGRKPSRTAVKSNMSLASNLGRGLEGLRLGSLGNLRNAIFKNSDKCFKHSNKSRTGSIQSAALQQALHREIEFQIANGNAEDPPVFQPLTQGQDRWSEKSSAKMITPGPDRWSEKSRDKMRTPGPDRGSKQSNDTSRRDPILFKPPTRQESNHNIH